MPPVKANKKQRAKWYLSGKTPRRVKAKRQRKRKASRKQLLDIGSNLSFPKQFRIDALKGARRLKGKK